MSILKWIERNYFRPAVKREDALRHRDFTALGNAINPEWRSGWSPDDQGSYETRRYVGQSAEGFHAGVEVAYRVYDPIVWGEAYATPEKARDASREMERRCWEEIDRCQDGCTTVARGRREED
jgi:hypothetical protein